MSIDAKKAGTAVFSPPPPGIRVRSGGPMVSTQDGFAPLVSDTTYLERPCTQHQKGEEEQYRPHVVCHASVFRWSPLGPSSTYTKVCEILIVPGINIYCMT